MYVEKKLKVNAEKVAFAKVFPGCLSDWKETQNKTIEHIIRAEKESVTLLIFSDKTFIPSSETRLQPASLIRLLLSAKPVLLSQYPEAFERLEALIAEDKEMQRLARMENIMGAIENNLPQIPELKDTLRQFVEAQDSD